MALMMHLFQSSPSATFVMLIRRLRIKAIYGGTAFIFSTPLIAY